MNRRPDDVSLDRDQRHQVGTGLRERDRMGPAHIFRHTEAGAATGGLGGGGLLARVQEVSWGRLRSGQAGAGFSPGVGDTDPPPGPSSTSWLLNHDQHTSGQEQPLSQGKGSLGHTERKVIIRGHTGTSTQESLVMI